MGEVLRVAPNVILVAAANPVDTATRVSGLPASRVISSGTILDTARFRTLLGRHLGVSPFSVHSYVLGEHGDNEVLAWSNARVDSLTLDQISAQVNMPIDDEVRARIDDGVRKVAYKIINGKGAIYYGIGGGLARLVEVIGRNQHAVFTLPSVTENVEGVRDVAVSVPRVLGSDGVTATLTPVLAREEHEALAKSAQMMREQVESLDL
ncbi:hypothetical protein [Breoghania sp.]|uniref:hypothetical protein n=1 Tax=Breoghania sp. TaxID=2065378 RepID=UPI002636EBCE|nr:hypothetical protein [Breoghania sp.]MDJ0931964.1 hypothetical protein [Breoghania sp.]